MEAWISVPVGETRRAWLQAIQNIPVEAHTQCFILASTYGSRDGPWSYVTFVLDPARPDALTAYFATIDADALDVGANPFQDGYGISLAQDEAYDLAALLAAQIDGLADAQGLTIPAFQLVKEEEYADFHLFSIASGHNSVEEHFYRQLQPHDTLAGDAIISIVEFRKDRWQPHGGVWFRAMQFRGSQLQEPSFRPNDYALPRISLDRNDIHSLIALFRKHLA